RKATLSARPAFRFRSIRSTAALYSRGTAIRGASPPGAGAVVILPNLCLPYERPLARLLLLEVTIMHVGRLASIIIHQAGTGFTRGVPRGLKPRARFSTRCQDKNATPAVATREIRNSSHQLAPGRR